jgi:hypothetical protein
MITGILAMVPSLIYVKANLTTGTARVGLFDAASGGYPARRDVQPNMYQFEMAYTLRRVPGASSGCRSS